MWKPIYASLTEARDWLRLRESEDTDDDALLRLKLGAASRAVDASCRRQFGKVDQAVERTYPLRWSRTLRTHVADIDDIMDLTGLTVTVNGTAIASTDYKLMPRNAIADGEPYTYIEVTGSLGSCGCGYGYSYGYGYGYGLTPSACRIELVMLGLWGWDVPTPDPIKESTLLQMSRLNIRRDSPYGIAGGADGGGELRLLARLDPDIEPLVVDYIRTGWVAR